MLSGAPRPGNLRAVLTAGGLIPPIFPVISVSPTPPGFYATPQAAINAAVAAGYGGAAVTDRAFVLVFPGQYVSPVAAVAGIDLISWDVFRDLSPGTTKTTIVGTAGVPAFTFTPPAGGNENDTFVMSRGIGYQQPAGSAQPAVLFNGVNDAKLMMSQTTIYNGGTSAGFRITNVAPSFSSAYFDNVDIWSAGAPCILDQSSGFFYFQHQEGYVQRGSLVGTAASLQNATSNHIYTNVVFSGDVDVVAGFSIHFGGTLQRLGAPALTIAAGQNAFVGEGCRLSTNVYPVVSGAGTLRLGLAEFPLSVGTPISVGSLIQSPAGYVDIAGGGVWATAAPQLIPVAISRLATAVAGLLGGTIP